MLFTTLGILGLKAGEITALRIAVKAGTTLVGSAAIARHEIKASKKLEKRLNQIKTEFREEKLRNTEDYPLTEEEQEMITDMQDKEILKAQIKDVGYTTVARTTAYMASEIAADAISKKEEEEITKAVLRTVGKSLIRVPIVGAI